MWAALVGGTRKKRLPTAAYGALLLLPLITAAPDQPARAGRTQQALHSFCQTFSGRPALCGPQGRVKRSSGAPWGQLLSNGTVGMPDTKWCGSGNSASGYDDLGRAESTDRCCRAHDHCPLSLTAGETRGGATNTGSFTRSDCRCDREFFDCLVRASTAHSQLVGELYFNILQPDCLRSARARCSRRKGSHQDHQDQNQRDQERLRFVRSPLAGRFPKPPNEEEMVDEAEDLAIRAWSKIFKNK